MAVLVLLVLSALTVPMFAGHPKFLAPENVAPVAEAPDAVTASQAAFRQGSRVEVADQTTPTSKTFANPDGTMTAEYSAVPLRVRRDTGWAAIDTTLSSDKDGTVRPKVADGDLALSGGGSGVPLAELTRNGKRLAVRWPGALPTPRLDGDKATYPEVFPGVDLVMVAERDGYQQQLVVKTAEAAKNPALAAITFDVETTGVALKVDDTGVLHAYDDSGKDVFTSPPSMMWDASGPSAATARSAEVGVELGARTLTVRPDLQFLADKTTVFPVVVDPNWRTFGWTQWATVLSGKPNTPYLRSSGDGVNAQVGNCYTAGGECNGIGIARAYFQFWTADLAGKRIISVSLDTTVNHSPNCSDRTHQLFAASYGINEGTTWNNAPPGSLVSESTAPGVWRGCPGNKPVGFAANGTINTAGTSTYFLKAANEGDQLSWRKYTPGDTRLTVRYNTRPDPAYNLASDPPVPAACRWCGGRPYVGDDFIRLKAQLSDPDGDAVKPWWHIYTDGVREERWGGLQASGAVHSTDVDLRGSDGKTIDWYVEPWDTYEDGNIADAGDWRRGPGPFVVDQTGVDVPPTVSGVVYQEDNRWHGGIGVPDRFTFSANGVGDIDHYLYGWRDPPSTQVDAETLGGSATVTIAPEGDGPRDLFVQSVDRAGHRSPTRVFHIYVRPGNGPLAQWSFEGNTKDEANLGFRDGTPIGNPTYIPGATGSAIKLNGIDQSVSAPNTVRTDAGFTVAAWAKLDRTDAGSYNLVSQDGVNNSGFIVQYKGDTGQWVFVLPQADSATPPGWTFVKSPAKAVAGEWTHLAASYDSADHKARLYVNGVLIGTTEHPSAWNAPGQIGIGRGFPGALDEVRMYDRRVSDAEVAAMVTGDNVQLGQWKFDEGTGTTADNAVPGGENATLHNGATFTADGALGGAVKLDGVDDYVATTGSVVHTDQSFSVSAWVKLDQLAAPGGARTVLSQEGTKDSGFYLQQRGTGWVLGMTAADGGTPSGFDVLAASPDRTAQAGTWTHLAAVYDADAKRGSLYVNGALAGSDTGAGPAWHANGPFLIGRAKAAGSYVDYVPGFVDEVRAYSRVLTASEIEALVSRDDVTQGSWKFDGDANDDSGRARNGSLYGGPTWTAGQANSPDQADLAVNLDGVDDYVAAPAGTDTSTSFSVTAWVKLNAQPDRWAAVASQNGEHTAAFNLGYAGKTNSHWAFAMHGPDNNSPSATRVVATQVAQAGVWTHLAAVYDKASGTMSLYINGVLSGTGTYTGPNWDAKGEFDIGRARWGSAWIDYLPGAVDDVKIYSRALFANEVRTQAGRDLSLVHDWKFDEPSGSGAFDAVGARTAMFTGGAGFSPGRIGNAVSLDGTGALATNGVDLRTDESFTVSAWVKLSSVECDLTRQPECKRVALSVDGGPDGGSEGGRTSKFRLGHLVDSGDNQLGAWIFEMPESDADNATITKAAVATTAEDIAGKWVHLVGVYDQPAKKLWLYVNGTRIGDGTLNARWNATGGAQIGRGKAAGAYAQYWLGSVDDARMYTGVLDKDRISALYKSYPAQDGGPATLPAADAGYWKFDENTGTAVGDSSGRGRQATLKGGAGWMAGGRNGPSSWLDGTSGYAETAGPVLDTTKSFSVAAWAHLTQTRNGDRTVLGQDGNRVSAFLLQYNAAADKWAVQVPTADQDNPAMVVLIASPTVIWGDWTHLVVVYDAQLHQLRLYVNGLLQAAQVGVTVPAGTGPLSMGRARWNGANAQFFPRGVDDVRAFGRALTDAEVAKVHDDAPAPLGGLWRFDDGTARDFSWRADDATLTGGTSFVPGVSGKALQLDGTSGAATAKWQANSMHDSFTVSAWAKLARTDTVSTVLAQEGDRMSGYALQYRPELNRWIFGAPETDTDSSSLVYAYSEQAPVLNQWTHLTGVYDLSGHQLRLYVDGKLAGIRANVTLWRAAGPFTLGRDKYNGKPADFFAGAIDEAAIFVGTPSEQNIQTRAGYPAPPPGQLGRYVNAAGDHYTANTGAAVPPGYHFEATLGMLPVGQQTNTRTLYACRAGTDGFTSEDQACEGKTTIGEIGRVYTRQPTNLPTVPIYRCANGTEHFDSRDPGCEAASNERLLGYTLAYGHLARYYIDLGPDHFSTHGAAPPGYWNEGTNGLLPLLAQPGTQPLTSCLDGVDQFVSLDANCEGKTVDRALGQIWTEPPPGLDSIPLYRCKENGESFVDYGSADCAGHTLDRRLGYVLSTLPPTPPVFAS